MDLSQRRLIGQREDLRRCGALRFLHRRVMRLLKPVLTVHFAKLRPLRPPSPEQLVVPAGFSIRIPTEDDLKAAAQDPHLQMSLRFVSNACRRHDICVAAYFDNRLVAYVWRAHQSCPHASGMWVEFPEPYRYGYKALTLEEYRGLHLQPELDLFSDNVSLARGATLGLSFVETHNYPSLALAKRNGSKTVGMSGWITLFGRTITFRSPGLRKRGIGFAFRGGDEV